MNNEERITQKSHVITSLCDLLVSRDGSYIGGQHRNLTSILSYLAVNWPKFILD